MPRSHRVLRRAGILTCLGLALAWPTLALAGTARFQIKAEPLPLALKAFAQQAHMQLLYEYAVVRNIRGNPVVGVIGKHAALEELLRNTGLEAKFSSNDAATITPIRPAKAADRPSPTDTSGRVRAKEPKRASSRGLNPATPDDTAPAKVDSSKAARRHTNNPELAALTEIIVTAQKYRQRLFDVPISLQVISGKQLEQHGITNLSNLQYDVPGLYMDSTGTSHTIYLRGVGNYYGTDSLVGQYIDDADITAETVTGASGLATGDNGLYDLKRVEVLKGPQGTLYGDGSMGGVIRYITNKPVLDRFQMSAHVAALFTQYGAPSQRIETMLNTPLIRGTLGLRVAGMFEHSGGWVDEPAANLKNINGGNLVDVRVEALWRPTAHLKARATQIIHRHTSGVGTGEDKKGNITPIFQTQLVPNQADDSDISNLTLAYDLGVARLLSSSTYLREHQDIYNYMDSFASGSLTFGELQSLESIQDTDYSEELRLVHNGGGPWQWTLGAFYKHFRTVLSSSGTYFGLATSPLSLASEFPGIIGRYGSSSWAGYANTSYTLFKRLTLGAGARYFKDRETIGGTGISNMPAANFTSVDPRFYVQYRFNPHVNTYASAAKGFRSGGFNTPPAAPYKPESLWSYDLGTKLRFPVHGLRADVDLFYMRYSKFVTEHRILSAPFYVDANVGNAKIEGVDADLAWRPSDHWRLGFNTEILRTKFLDATAISGYAPGERLPFAPKYSFTTTVARDFRWDHKPGEVELYYYQISRVQFRALGYPLMQSDRQHFLTARASIRWNEDLRLGVFVHNLLNDRGYESPLYSLDDSVRPRPRTYGVEFNVRFGWQ